MELANALAACCLSGRMNSGHRQWAAQHLVQILSTTERNNNLRPQTYADLAGDLRKCPTVKLEAHENRVCIHFLDFFVIHSPDVYYDVVN